MWEQFTTDHSPFGTPSDDYLDALDALEEYIHDRRSPLCGRPTPVDPLFHCCGIYGIACDITGQVYVGMTSRSFLTRWRGHRYQLDYGKHVAANLQRLWDRYGSEQFTFCILAVKPGNEGETWLRERERYWIATILRQGGLLNQGLTGRKIR